MLLTLLCVLSTEDTLNFWKGIADVGLLGEVVTNINTELVELLNSVQQRRDSAALQDTGTELHYCALAAKLMERKNKLSCCWRNCKKKRLLYQHRPLRNS